MASAEAEKEKMDRPASGTHFAWSGLLIFKILQVLLIF